MQERGLLCARPPLCHAPLCLVTFHVCPQATLLPSRVTDGSFGLHLLCSLFLATKNDSARFAASHGDSALPFGNACCRLQHYLVANRAQRCEIHKLAVVWWVGGIWSCVRISCWLPFWLRTILRAILKDCHGCPPSLRKQSNRRDDNSSAAPAVSASPAPAVEHIGPAPVIVYIEPTPAASVLPAQLVEYIEPAPVVNGTRQRAQSVERSMREGSGLQVRAIVLAV